MPPFLNRDQTIAACAVGVSLRLRRILCGAIVFRNKWHSSLPAFFHKLIGIDATAIAYMLMGGPPTDELGR